MAHIGRRRFGSLLVEPFQQVKLGLIFLVGNLLFGLVILLVFGYYVYDIYDAVQTYFALSNQESMMTFSKMAVPLGVCCGVIVLFIIGTLYASIVYTHAIYGPLVSINRFLDDVLNGKPPGRILLRESDQLKGLATKLNTLADRFAADQNANSMTQIHKYLDELGSGINPQPLQLRAGDGLESLAMKLNSLAVKMQRTSPRA